jgi:hypothetical protein
MARYFPALHPEDHQCEAKCICVVPSIKIGDRCRSVDTKMQDGRWLCWLHRQRGVRAMPLLFVDKKKEAT